MELSHLFESEESDRAARLQANIAHKQIKYWLEANEERLPSRLQRVNSGTLAGGYALPAERCDLDADYPDLIVVFTPKGGTDIGHGYATSGGFARAGGKSIIVVPCLLAPFDLNHVATRFGAGFKRTFVHEFMHYLMSHRATPGREPSAAKFKRDGEAAYFNDADETNAYYQEAAQDMVEMVHSIVNHAPKFAQEWATQSTSELMAYVYRRYLDKNFLAHASEKTRRALDKRLARFIETTIRPMLLSAKEKGGENPA